MDLRGMEEEVFWKYQVLNEKRAELCKCLNPKDHYPWLRSKYILSRDDEEVIESERTTKDKVHKLIDLIVKKLPLGFDEMVKSLIDGRTQLHIAEMLNREFENKRRICYSARNHVCKTVSAPVMSYQSTSSISDLGVDTDKLPKPQLPKKITKDVEKDSDSKRDSEKEIIIELEQASKYR